MATRKFRGNQEVAGPAISNRELRLETIRQWLKVRGDEYTQLSLENAEFLEQIQDELGFRMDRYIWGERLAPKFVSYPENWWEAFKERFFPFWLSLRFPVAYKRIEITTTALYPDFKPIREAGTHTFRVTTAEFRIRGLT